MHSTPTGCGGRRAAPRPPLQPAVRRGSEPFLPGVSTKRALAHRSHGETEFTTETRRHGERRTLRKTTGEASAPLIVFLHLSVSVSPCLCGEFPSPFYVVARRVGARSAGP